MLAEGDPAFAAKAMDWWETAVLYHLRGQDARAPTPAPEAIEHRSELAGALLDAPSPPATLSTTLAPSMVTAAPSSA